MLETRSRTLAVLVNEEVRSLVYRLHHWLTTCTGNGENGQIDDPREQAAALRRERMANIVGRVGPSNLADSSNKDRTIGAATRESELDAIRTNSSKRSAWSINFSIRLSSRTNSVDKSLGNGCVQIDPDTTMPGKYSALFFAR